jgi:glycyl-tRNA synthetase beta chain
MSTPRDCLIELFTEELPPKALRKLQTCFQESMQAQLKEAQFDFTAIHPFATPRRLALFIEDLASTQPDQSIERKGPALRAAYDKDGKPTRACQGFADSLDVPVETLTTIDTDKGEYLYCQITKKGEVIQTRLPEFITHAVKQLPAPKFMRWGNKPFQFIRPLHNLIVLFGDELINMELLGCQSNTTLHGHRFMTEETITLDNPNNYESLLLKKGRVIASFDKRKQAIKDGIQKSVSKQFKDQANAVISDALLDEVTALVEWPSPLIVPFDPQFLSVPQEALISAMEQHQKCFAIRDNAGKLLPHFITISNIDSKDPKQVIHGNERVMHARLSDAAFFYNTDCAKPLSDLTEKLQSITYEKSLGSLHDKVNRVAKLALLLAKEVSTNEDTVARAAELCKSDLVSLMVEEFPNLQGTMGKYYAKNDGESEAVANALFEHYLPRHAGDSLPSSTEAAVIAIADRLDTLVGIIGIGSIPTGDKDPFGLRRAALGILRILIEKSLPLDLTALIDQSIAQFDSKALTQKDLKTRLLQFFSDRFRSFATNNGIATDTFLSVIETGITSPSVAFEKMKAVTHFRTAPEAASLASANKRVSNILNKQAGNASLQFDKQHLVDSAEKQLSHALENIDTHFQSLINNASYKEALLLLADLNQPINQFFDEVMVMTEDETLRNNRLALLQKVRSLFLQIADIALLQ